MTASTSASLSAPGVAPADMSVTVHPDPRVREIEIAGETTVHGMTYSIDKRYVLPREAELEEGGPFPEPRVSLANGILTLTVAKRADPEPIEKMKLTVEVPETAKAPAAAAEQEPMME